LRARRVGRDASAADATTGGGSEDALLDEVQAFLPDATLNGTSEQLPCDAAVPVCIDYFKLLETCLDRDVLALACQPTLIPDGPDQLPQIESVCQDNLQRLQVACR
jgi:hypothetical protein